LRITAWRRRLLLIAVLLLRCVGRMGNTTHEAHAMKASGYRRFGGKAATDDLTGLPWITIQTGPRPYPF
jgi:hypothetical protein